MERFDDFFIEGRPYLDKMVLKIIRDPATRTIGLENGEIDFYAFENVPTNINRLKKNANLNVTPDGYAAIGPIDWLAFNTKTGKTADVKVRQAIAYAIDRIFILKAIMLGVADEARTGIHPGSPYYEPNVEAYDFDIDKANKILDDAGYKKEVTVCALG